MPKSQVFMKYVHVAQEKIHAPPPPLPQIDWEFQESGVVKKFKGEYEIGKKLNWDFKRGQGGGGVHYYGYFQELHNHQRQELSDMLQTRQAHTLYKSTVFCIIFNIGMYSLLQQFVKFAKFAVLCIFT